MTESGFECVEGEGKFWMISKYPNSEPTMLWWSLIYDIYN
jgi:hypothetical protein